MILYDNIAEAQITVDATKRTADGYLAASARVARTGIQIYSGRECGRPEMDFVRVYRPEDEVFKPDAVKTFAHRPITDDHPHEPVTADNWKRVSKGHTGEEIIRDGKFIRIPMLLMDGPTIKKWEQGKRELSMGYSCDLKWQDGITEDGEEYDAIQMNIKANHLALVSKARGGEHLHIGDAKEEEGDFIKIGPDQYKRKGGKGKIYTYAQVQAYYASGGWDSKNDSADNVHAADDLDNVDGNGETLMKITVDGISMEMNDKDAQIVQRALDAAADERDELFKKLETTEEEQKKKKKEYETDSATLKTQVATLTTENTQLKQQVADAAMTPEKMDAMIKNRANVIDKAKIILGADKVDLKLTDSEIRRACVNHVVGADAKDWSDEIMAAAFTTIKTTAGNGVKKLAAAFDQQPQNMEDAAEAAYKRRDERLRTAWQGKSAIQ